MQDEFDVAGALNSGGWLIFPASRDDIIALAQKKHLPPDVIADLQRIPEKVYNNIGELAGAALKISY